MHFENDSHDTPKSESNHESLTNTEAARHITSDLELFDTSIPKEELRFTHILSRLSESNLLGPEAERVKALYLTELGDFGNELEPEIWEMLTVLELFDPETAQHCVDTYQIAKSKVEKVLFNGLVLADSFSEEGVSLHTFYVSCLLHDIGKVEVPHSVVINSVSDLDCSHRLFQEKETILLPALHTYLDDPTFELPADINSGDQVHEYLYNTLHIRPKAITPIHLLLDEMTAEEKEEIEQQLQHCGHTLNDPLLEIMRTHDRYSHDILLASGHKTEAILAGSHHRNTEHAYTITVGTLRVSIDLADILHLADVENALVSNRHYHNGESSLRMLKILTIHADHGDVPSYITYLWVADTLHKMQDSFDFSNITEKEDYDAIVTFLEEQQKNHLAYPNWRKGINIDIS